MDEFIEAIWGQAAGFVEVRCFSDSGDAKKPIQKWMSTADLKSKLPTMAEWGARNRLGIFAGVLPRMTEGGGSARDTAPARVVWCDLDFKDYTGGETEARHQLGRFHPYSILVQSGNGLHAYWLLEDEHKPEALSKACR